MTKHKWHDEIVAWAGGAKIQARRNLKEAVWFDIANPEWIDIGYEYRIKSQPVQPKYLYAYSYMSEIRIVHENHGNLKWVYIGKIEVQP